MYMSRYSAREENCVDVLMNLLRVCSISEYEKRLRLPACLYEAWKIV